MSNYVRAYEGDEPYIFVSYAHKDSEAVLSVIRQLYDGKYRVWYDEGIQPGTEWPPNIARHLQRAAMVIVFVSENSLRSPNCINEIQSISKDAEIAVIDLRGDTGQSLVENATQYDVPERVRDKLSGQESYAMDDNLMSSLADHLDISLIGDGITGYTYSIDKKRGMNRWNVLLGIAVILSLVFAVLLYNLYTGTFDSLLPGKQPGMQIPAPTAEPLEVISIENTMLGSLLPVVFSTDEEKESVYQMFGWEHPYEMTYKDLMGIDWITHFEIRGEPIESIQFAAYLPNLESLVLANTTITDLTPLQACPNLTTVQITADMLPVTLPTPRKFEVEII